MNTHITLFELISLFIGGILVYTLIKTILQELTKYK
jgi:hypothetical protein